MSKYDDVLNELVYQIDDIVYEFYNKSNEIIARKSDQDRLLTFRDKTLATINDMNVRSLEIISDFKNKELVEARAEQLLKKNRQIVSSSLDIINSASDKSEFLEDVTSFATGVYESAKEAVSKVEGFASFERLKEKTSDGFKRATDGLDEFMNHPNVTRGTETVKEKTKDALDAGGRLVKEGSDRLAKWLDKQDAKKKDFETEVHDTGEQVRDDAVKFINITVDDVEDAAEDIEEESLTLLNKSNEYIKEKLEKVQDFFESDKDVEVVDKALDHVNEVGDKAEDIVENIKDEAEDKVEDIKSTLEEEVKEEDN
ncbi:hypothetical protein H9L01_07550 [Erysipelothrix inopinata]|uniref:YtxH domain-containing protein n=1 Tax=Erysipelothrix inopinata TaxID=225084 RepID=A0A7G9RX94_9FIRM|nr:hypothetical protein [Erysipelothrix inopinata]QNN60219.1 hypothetical protein H9L01_07550 [Erysipelothrix inopinata]